MARSFYAHDRNGHRQDGRLIGEAENFHDAALTYAEHAGADGELAVLVRDCESGEEQCFVVDLDEGDATPC